MANTLPLLGNLRIPTGGALFGTRIHPITGVRTMHNGIDLNESPFNRDAPIICVADGVVTQVRRTGVQGGAMCHIRIRHDNGFNTWYTHQRTNTITQSVGDRVRRGDRLGIIGTTGQSTGVHLHFQIDRGTNATAINPWGFLFDGVDLFGQGTTNPQEPTTPPILSPNPTHVVIRNETLSGIARRYNTTVAELARLNNISNVNLIRVGQVLRLPKATASPQIVVGSRVRLTDNAVVFGTTRRFSARVYAETWIVLQIRGDRVVIHRNANPRRGEIDNIMSPIDVRHLILQ